MPATVHLIVGLPGAGKTTHAKAIESRESALRLTPDEWLWAVFPDDTPTAWRSPERVVQRDRLEGKLVGLGLRAAQLGLDVVFDFGLWGRDERWGLRWLAESVGATARVVYLPIGHEEQRRRITARTSRPGEFELGDAELRQWRAQFQEPDAAELEGGPIPAPPPGLPDWPAWARDRWPSLSL